MSPITGWALRCSFEGCREELSALARTTSEFIDFAEAEGWKFPFNSNTDYSAVWTSGGLVHCPEHADTDEWGAWTDQKARWVASCETCGEDFRGSEEACGEWRDDHECTPLVRVRQLRA